jgi:hypothetical protein
MILLLLNGRGIVSGLFEKRRDAIPPHPAPPSTAKIDSLVNNLEKRSKEYEDIFEKVQLFGKPSCFESV